MFLSSKEEVLLDTNILMENTMMGGLILVRVITTVTLGIIKVIMEAILNIHTVIMVGLDTMVSHMDRLVMCQRTKRMNICITLLPVQR